MYCPSIATDAATRMGLATVVRIDAARQADDMRATCVSTFAKARFGPGNTTLARSRVGA
jgi:hypothetical protein